MNIVIPAFPGDLPRMVLQARSVEHAARNSGIDRVYIVLIMHRNDQANYEAVESIIRELIVPLFGSLSPCVRIVRYGGLFPGSGGHSNSATAKQASAVAFAAEYLGIGDILVLDEGEALIAESLDRDADCTHAGSDLNPGVRDSYRSLRYSQAGQLLNILGGGQLGGISSNPKSYFISCDSLAEIDKSLRGGLSSISNRIIDGEIVCDLRDIYCVWACKNCFVSHRKRLTADLSCVSAQRKSSGSRDPSEMDTVKVPDRHGASIRCVTLDVLRASNPRFSMEETGLGPTMDEVARRVSLQEKYNAGLASAVIRLLSELRNGSVSFVQVGANDGEFLDPISPCIDPRSWSGLVIEPIPHYFGRLKQRYAEFANVTPLQCAVGNDCSQRPMYYVDDGILGKDEGTDGPEWLKGIASFSIEHLLRHGVARQSIKQISVEVRGGSDILRQHLPGAIDLLVVDVEGAEREVLESFELQASQPACIIFECEHLGADDEKTLKELLQDCGYSIWWTRPDAIAVKSSSELEKAFRDLKMEGLGI